MKIGYPIAIVLAVLSLMVTVTDGFGALDNANAMASTLILGSLVATIWQREYDRGASSTDHR